METLQEATYCTSSIRVDREKHVVHGVKIHGQKSKNKRTYSPRAMKEIVNLAEGKQVNIDHTDPKAAKTRSYRDRFGVLRGVHIAVDGDAYADFHFNPKHDITEQFLWDAENNPTNVGFSVDARGVTIEHNGQRLVESVQLLRSVDLVCDPATVQSLFESTEPEGDPIMSATTGLDLKSITLDQLRRDRADLIESLLADIGQSEKDKQREKELTDLKEENQRLKAEKDLVTKRESILTELKEAKLDVNDEVQVSKPFMSILLESKDATTRKPLIEDRVKLLESTLASRTTTQTDKPFPSTGTRHTGKGTTQAGATSTARRAAWAR